MMFDVISVENMRNSDAATIAGGVPSLVLMQRAAMGVYRSFDGWQGKKVKIACGSGNNGGDGYALALILKEKGIDVSVYGASDRHSPDSAYYYEKAVQDGIVCDLWKPGDLMDADLIVDCLLGTGTVGEPAGIYAQMIKEINDSRAQVISVDINSGMNGDTGEAILAVRSDLTVTIGCLKKGLLAKPAGKYIGSLALAKIGIEPVVKEEVITEEEYPSWFKGTYRTVL